jgi:hypothetical protein
VMACCEILTVENPVVIFARAGCVIVCQRGRANRKFGRPNLFGSIVKLGFSIPRRAFAPAECRPVNAIRINSDHRLDKLILLERDNGAGNAETGRYFRGETTGECPLALNVKTWIKPRNAALRRYFFSIRRIRRRQEIDMNVIPYIQRRSYGRNFTLQP